MKKIAMALIVLIGFVGCGEEVKTVEYYLKNKEAREAKIKECKNNPGGLKDNPNCINAYSAQSKSGIPPRTESKGKGIDDFVNEVK